jgi:hypothetical protein
MKLQSTILLVFLLAICGCGANTVEVTGTVKFDGEPVNDGQIAFITSDSGASGGGPITNGSYRVQVPPGKTKVQITANKRMKLPEGETGMDGATEEVRQYIPVKYNAETELTKDITATNPSIDFDLKSK